MNDALQAATVTIAGDGGDSIEAYSASPLDPTPTAGVVVIHHMPGFDERDQGDRPALRRRAATRPSAPTCTAARVPAPLLRRRVAADSRVGRWRARRPAAGRRMEASMPGLSAGAAVRRNGKVGVIGFCSGRPQVYLAACRIPRPERGRGLLGRRRARRTGQLTDAGMQGGANRPYPPPTMQVPAARHLRQR